MTHANLQILVSLKQNFKISVLVLLHMFLHKEYIEALDVWLHKPVAPESASRLRYVVLPTFVESWHAAIP
ncbi:hypothetical protein GBA52_025279 [Prunus armeniaca]|nr:hypothetical protein GBA52_025279 [Prunus armeniaca]